MKRNISSHSLRDDKHKSSKPEDYDVALRSRTEEEKQKRRREWLIQQQREREHEKLKRKMILEYEMKRAREQGLPLPKRNFSDHSPSKSKSKSPERRHRKNSVSGTAKPRVMSEKLESLRGPAAPLFKGPEGTKISTTELKRIKVDIHRNIPSTTTTSLELQRDIVNPEDVVLRRRDGEGSKPIFEREEIKRAVNAEEEIEERRIVLAIDNDESADKSRATKKRSASLSPVRRRSHSPRHLSPYSRYEESKHEGDRRVHDSSRRSNRDRKHSRDRSREYRERCEEDVRRCSSSRLHRDNHTEKRRDYREHSRSRDREQGKRDRSPYRKLEKDERVHRKYNERSCERSRDAHERERSKERRVPPPHYIEQIPVPVYYGNFPPRPIMVGPMVPLRGQIPGGRGRHPPMMGPLRPFNPRFFPPDMYRLGMPPNTRFGPMF